ncbi:MAG: HAMP domain-containing sensor histidine kinase [Polyangiaceae bacterium]
MNRTRSIDVPRRRLTRKLVAYFLAPTAVCMIAFAVLMWQMWRKTLILDASEDLADQVALLQAALVPLGEPSRQQELVKTVDAIADCAIVHGVAVYDEEGHALARSKDLRSSSARARIDEIAHEVLAKKRAFHDVERLGDADALIHADLMPGPTRLGAVVLTHSLASVRGFVGETLQKIALVGGALTVIIGALALWVSRSLGRGIGDLVHAAGEVRQGRLDVRIDESQPFELDSVASAFNEMTASLVVAATDLERAELERREIQRRVMRAQPLTIVGQVSASFAHEIGSPLNTILGWSRLGASDESVPKELKKQFETITTQCERITRIVERMLAVARPTIESNEAVKLDGVVREVAAFVAPDCKARGIQVVVKVEDDLPTVHGVRDRLIQVVMNLAMNALQAQSQGGVLRIEVTKEIVHVGGNGVPPKIDVVLDVADAGPGVSDEAAKQIFDTYYSTKRSEGGSGLGLPIVADVVRDLGGRVTVDRAPEGGARFRVRIPVAT